ncbi:hypothetical protein FXO37_31040 [Capsicum annuum]|nr:hypothetical protein FXO37_31040 [Capsicum annuum]
MKKKNCVVQAQLCRCIITFEVKGSSSSGIVIRANGTFLNFTPRKFAIVTGLNCVSNRLKTGGKFYLIQGMPLAIQVWLYACCSNVSRKIASKVVFKNIEPTQIELAQFQIPQKDVIEDEHSVDSDDDFQDPQSKQINERSKKKQKVDSSTPIVKKPSRKKSINIVNDHTQKRTATPRTARAAGMRTPIFKPIQTKHETSSKTKKLKQTARAIFPPIQSKPESPINIEAVSKSDSSVEKEAFISKNVFDAFRDEQKNEDKDFEPHHMDYAGAKTSLQRFSLNVDQNLSENQDGTKGCTDLHSDKSNIEIDSQLLIPDDLLRNELLPSLNAYRRKSITTPPSTTREEPTDEHLNDKKSESVVEDHCQQIDVCFYYLRKKAKYDPNRSYKFSTVYCNFMNIIRSVHYIYIVDDPNLNAGEQEAHLNEYINGFHMHVVVPWHTVEDIYIPVNIKGKHHWVLAILSFSERYIFLDDSYESSGHYPIVLAEIEKLAEIIPLCIQACDFYDKKGIDL